MVIDVLLPDGMEQIEVADEELFSFPQGIVGFEEYGRYALLELEPPLYLLQAVDDPHVGFVLIDPSLVYRHYRAPLAAGDRQLLQLTRSERPNIFCIVTMSAEGENPTINLKAPVAINARKRLGAQVILQDMSYPVRHPIPLTAEGALDLQQMEAATSRSESQSRNGTGDRRSEAARCSS